MKSRSRRYLTQICNSTPVLSYAVLSCVEHPRKLGGRRRGADRDGKGQGRAGRQMLRFVLSPAVRCGQPCDAGVELQYRSLPLVRRSVWQWVPLLSLLFLPSYLPVDSLAHSGQRLHKGGPSESIGGVVRGLIRLQKDGRLSVAGGWSAPRGGWREGGQDGRRTKAAGCWPSLAWPPLRE